MVSSPNLDTHKDQQEQRALLTGSCPSQFISQFPTGCCCLLEATVSATVSIEHPFDVNDDDHCETSLEAYRDVVPILHHFAAWSDGVRLRR